MTRRRARNVPQAAGIEPHKWRTMYPTDDAAADLRRHLEWLAEGYRCVAEEPDPGRRGALIRHYRKNPWT
jgi:hypothetical protein